MKYNKTIIFTILFAFFNVSCNFNQDTKQKEIELKEKELELKERELNLLENKKQTIKSISVSKNIEKK